MFLYLILLAMGCFELTKGSVATINIGVSDLLHMQHGMGWPSVLQLTEGQDALIKLKSQTSIRTCHVTTPMGEKFNINSPSSSKFEKWSDGCGVRIKTIVKKDEGRWRLTATNGNRTFIGYSQIHVHSDISQYRAPDITLEDGQKTTVLLSTLADSYCYVEQPFSEGSLVAGPCAVTLPRATRAVQGTWNVFLGIPGRVQEVHLQRQVSVKSETLDAGYIYDREANKLHLYCNLMHTARNITFCRFQKTSTSSGFNVLDGLSDGRHSYYGTGLLDKQCGMTIEQPENVDFGTWRCSVGVHVWVAEHREYQPPVQALISVTNVANSVTKVRRNVYEHEDTSSVFVQEDQPFTLYCRKDAISLRYCWFQHPNGTQYTPTHTQTQADDLEFWYEGESLQSGDCGITFKRATNEDSGEWICHMGARDTYGIEIADKINVKVTGALAANRKEIVTKIGDTVHLFCHTSNGNRPLEYCRFLSPQFVGINIHTTITEANAIDGHYYFTAKRELGLGDCSLTIKNVRQQDIGPWTCAALIIDNVMEASDVIYLSEISRTRQPLSQASIVGMTVGISILVIGLALFLVYKKFGPPSQWRYRPQVGVLSMSDIMSRASNGSSSSEDSVTSTRNLNATGDERPVNSPNINLTNMTVHPTPNIVTLE